MAFVDIIFSCRGYNFAFRKAIRAVADYIEFKAGFHSFVRVNLFVIGVYL